jgi:CrcB protein
MTQLALITCIGLAGALGAISRYALQTWVSHAFGHPTLWATFAVNISGAFIIGLLVSLAEVKGVVPANLRVILAIGFLGAYTTFSTLTLESVNRLENGDTLAALTNVAGSIVVGLAATYAGLQLGRNL